MKKIRVTILLSILVGIVSLWLVNPKLLQDGIYASIGQRGQAYLMEMYGQKGYQEPVAAALTENMTALQLRERVNTTYQLKPDMRFIQAAEYLQYFVTGQTLEPAQLEWARDQWEVTLDNKIIGVLPAYADFEQGLDFLHIWTRELTKTNRLKLMPAVNQLPPEPAGRDGFNPMALIENLARLNSQWASSGRSGNTIHEASISLTRLALVNRDFIQLGDMHNSRTMAVLSLAISINHDRDYSELKSQLAYTMGYTADATQFATSLPEDNLWRGFIDQDDRLLIDHLADNSTENEARYYWLLRLAQLGNSEKWMRHLSRYYAKERIPVHALLTGYELKQTNLYSYLSHTIPLVMVELTGGPRVWEQLANEVITLLPRSHQELARPVLEALQNLLRPGLRTVLRTFNQKIKEGQPNYNGLFLDGLHWKSYQNSLLFNSIYKQGTYALDFFNNPDDTRYIANQLTSSESVEAKLIGRYLEVLTLASEDKASIDEVTVTIEAIREFGATPVFRLFEEIENNFEYGSPEVAVIMSNMVSAMDSRIDARFDYASAMSRYLLNIGIAERVYETIIHDSPSDSLQIRAWRAFYFRDIETVYELLDDPRLRFEDAQYIADRFKARNLTDADLDKYYLKIIDRYPSRLNLSLIYVEALEERKRYQEGLVVMLHWHKIYADKFHQNHRFRALTYISRAYRKDGKLEKAKAALQPTLNGRYGFGYYEATEIAIVEGEFENAVRIAEKVRARYPSSNFSLKNSLRAYWSNSNYSKAAKLLKNAPSFSFSFWRSDLGKIFSETFKNNVPGGTLATSALVSEGLLSIKIAELARNANDNGLHQLAFNTSNQLKYQGSDNFVYKLHAYKALKQWKGKNEALAWLKNQHPEEQRNSLSMIIYYQQEYDLLWDFIEMPEKGSHPYGVWYIRAAAQVMGTQKDEARSQQLHRYYNKAEHDNFYDDLGRLALGINSDEKLLNTSFSAKRLGEVSYYKGVYEYSQGSYQEAANWFRTTVETRLPTNGEYRWAYGTLYLWANKSTELRTQIEDSL